MQTTASHTRKVRLYGLLAARFGDEFDVAAVSPVEAIRILEANFPGEFSGIIREGMWHVVVGDTTKPDDYYTEDMLQFMSTRGDIHIIPAHQGAGKGLLKAILGISMIALAFVTAGGSMVAGAGLAGFGTALGASTGFLGVTWGSVALFGASLLFSGVASMLTPSSKDKTGDTGNAKTDSFFFNGPINKTNEDAAIPVVYGRVLAGTVVVYGSITYEKLDPGAITPKTNPAFDVI